jgi:hypothetical protein
MRGTLSTSQNCRLRNTQLALIHGEGNVHGYDHTSRNRSDHLGA